MYLFQNKTTRWMIIFIFLFLIIILLLFRKQKVNQNENFTAFNKEYQFNTSNPDIMQPEYQNLENGSVMSGSKFIDNNIVIPAWGEQYYGISETLDNNDLSDGKGGSFTLYNNICSKSCCSGQYPTPFDLPKDDFVCKNKDKFLPSNYTCNNSWQDAGCICITKDQASFIYNRGLNS